MLTTRSLYAIGPAETAALDTSGLRENFHFGEMFAPGEARLLYTHYDRMIVGGVEPGNAPLILDHVAECGTPSVLDRREMGVLNVGAPAPVEAGGESYTLAPGDMLYLGLGSGPVTFGPGGRFYVTSTPAHRACPARHIRPEDATQLELGAQETANRRTILQFIHPTVMESCQLVMGYTRLHPGSVWNTMPAHTHDRRMEAYFYFDMGADTRVMHFMGQPDETRHIVMANHEAVISPPWSIHCGAGTSAYTFCWVMGGDNVDYTDMDMVPMAALR